MTFQPGAKLGRYEIRSKIGEGVMCEMINTGASSNDNPVIRTYMGSDVILRKD